MTEAVGYTRLSQESDTSIEDQKQEIKELADEKGFKLLTIYNDGERSSGFNNERPEYLQMQAEIEEHGIDALIVRDRDRLSRDKRERSVLYYDLEEWGADLWTTVDGERVDFEDDEDWLIEMIRNYMDDVQKRREIQKARTKVQKRIENGYWQGEPRIGTQFDEEGRYLVPDEDFETVLDAIDMNEQGVPKTEISERTGIPRSTLYNIYDRQTWYLQLAQKHGYLDV